ncbi:MAG: carotenoid biosynthesis protein [Phycisphaerales bacterium]|nr:MAG: carotenoid biosynthesis protein [Phycisphaerales bacterium]
MAGRFLTTWFLRFCSVLLAATVLGIWSGRLTAPLWWPLTFVLVVMPFAFSLLHAVTSMGHRRGLLLVSLAVAATLLFETVGVLTGAVFGPYHYTDVLGPGFLGLVPYAVPLMSFVLVYPSYMIAEWLVPAGRTTAMSGLAVAALAASMTTVIDVARTPSWSKVGLGCGRAAERALGFPRRTMSPGG